MVDRWPHTFDLVLPGASTKDAQGNTINALPIAELTTIGRAKVSGNDQSTILSETGDVMPTSHTITFPWFAQDFTNGQVSWEGKTYSIIRFRQYQNRCKIWV